MTILSACDENDTQYILQFTQYILLYAKYTLILRFVKKLALSAKPS